MSTHYERNFHVIRGGLKYPPGVYDMIFESAYVTNTRYMGVVGLCVHYLVARNPNPESSSDYEKLCQLYYFESEEYGLEEYASVKGDDDETVEALKMQLFGGLGGRYVKVTEKEAIYLLGTFVDFNLKRSLPLPDGKEEFMYYLSEPVPMTAKERAVVQSKICCQISNNFEAIHYFLMRVFGKDFSAAANLVKGNVLMNQFETMPICTLCMNTLDIHQAGEFSTYIAESLVEADDEYTIILSEVTVNRDHQITDFSSRSSMRITAREAAMKLRKSEYVTVYSFRGGVDVFENRCPNIVADTISSEAENGNMYMRFRRDNDHVKKRIFRISDDVEGLYYVSLRQGQILATAYSLSSILQLEADLRISGLAPVLTTEAKYEFKEPVILDFISSGIENFNDYLEAVRNGGGDDDE